MLILFGNNFNWINEIQLVYVLLRFTDDDEATANNLMY